MASILLNDNNPARLNLVKEHFSKAGHEVWTADHLNEIIAILHDVSVDVMVLDLDQHDLDELVQFGERWKGVAKLIHANCTELFHDARCSLADQCLCKEPGGRNLIAAIDLILKKRQGNPVN